MIPGKFESIYEVLNKGTLAPFNNINVNEYASMLEGETISEIAIIFEIYIRVYTL